MNLIQNGSFERVDTPVCWNSGSFVNACVFPNTRNVTNWDWFNSPDYFSTNVPYTVVFRGVPINDFGNSYPKHNIAYGGIISYTKMGDTKEYINQQLAAPLKADSVYCLSFFASRADRTTHSIHSLGAYFSNNLPSMVNNLYISASPQVVNQNGFITDTIGWTEIKGCFTAQGGEQYITIGNFNSNANTDTLFVGSTDPLSTAPGYAYYYLDSVTLWKNNFPTSVKEVDTDERVSVYPNPVERSLTLTLSEGKGTEPRHCLIKITDVLGREVLVSDYKEQLDISHLEHGVYFIKIEQGSKTLGVKKIIKN